MRSTRAHNKAGAKHQAVKSEKLKKLKIGEALRAAKAYEAVKAGAQHLARPRLTDAAAGFEPTDC